MFIAQKIAARWSLFGHFQEQKAGHPGASPFGQGHLGLIEQEEHSTVLSAAAVAPRGAIATITKMVVTRTQKAALAHHRMLSCSCL